MHIIFSLKNLFFLLKFCVKILFRKHYFSLPNTFMRKGKDPEPDSDPDPKTTPLVVRHAIDLICSRRSTCQPTRVRSAASTVSARSARAAPASRSGGRFDRPEQDFINRNKIP